MPAWCPYALAVFWRATGTPTILDPVLGAWTDGELIARAALGLPPLQPGAWLCGCFRPSRGDGDAFQAAPYR